MLRRRRRRGRVHDASAHDHNDTTSAATDTGTSTTTTASWTASTVAACACQAAAWLAGTSRDLDGHATDSWPTAPVQDDSRTDDASMVGSTCHNTSPADYRRTHNAYVAEHTIWLDSRNNAFTVCEVHYSITLGNDASIWPSSRSSSSSSTNDSALFYTSIACTKG